MRFSSFPCRCKTDSLTITWIGMINGAYVNNVVDHANPSVQRRVAYTHRAIPVLMEALFRASSGEFTYHADPF